MSRKDSPDLYGGGTGSVSAPVLISIPHRREKAANKNLDGILFLRFRVHGTWFRVLGSRQIDHGSGFRLHGSWFDGSWFMVPGSWFVVQGSGFRVQGS